MTSSPDLLAIERLSRSFTPTRPIALPDFLSGRINLLYRLMNDILTPSQHVLLYGDRGVGKTSLARVLAVLAQETEDPNGRRSISVSCDSNDTYGSIWRKVFQEILLKERQLGFDLYQDRSIVGRWDPDHAIFLTLGFRSFLPVTPSETSCPTPAGPQSASDAGSLPQGTLASSTRSASAQRTWPSTCRRCLRSSRACGTTPLSWPPPLLRSGPL